MGHGSAIFVVTLAIQLFQNVLWMYSSIPGPELCAYSSKIATGRPFPAVVDMLVVLQVAALTSLRWIAVLTEDLCEQHSPLFLQCMGDGWAGGVRVAAVAGAHDLVCSFPGQTEQLIATLVKVLQTPGSSSLVIGLDEQSVQLNPCFGQVLGSVSHSGHWLMCRLRAETEPSSCCGVHAAGCPGEAEDWRPAGRGRRDARPSTGQSELWARQLCSLQ